MNSKKSMPRHIILKLVKVRDKEKNPWKQPERIDIIIQENNSNDRYFNRYYRDWDKMAHVSNVGRTANPEL